MKKIIIAAVVSSFCVAAQAEVGAFAGLTYLFGEKGGLGFTIKAVSTRDENKALGAIGLNFYPGAQGQKFGIDIGAGYNWKSSAVILGYDILNMNPTISGGWSNTKKKEETVVADDPGPT